MRRRAAGSILAMFSVAACLALLLSSHHNGVPVVEASHIISASPQTQNVVAGQTDIVVTIVGTDVPANVSSFYIELTYPAALLTPSGNTCGDSTGNSRGSWYDYGLVIFCGNSPPVASIYGTGGAVTLATITFTAVGSTGSATLTASWIFLDQSLNCIGICADVGSYTLGSINVIDPATYDTDGDNCPDIVEIANQGLREPDDPLDSRDHPDFDADGRVDFDDFLRLAAAYGTTNSLADLDADGRVDFDDFLRLAAAYARRCP